MHTILYLLLIFSTTVLVGKGPEVGFPGMWAVISYTSYLDR
jgi:hypothetical protein